MTTALACPVDGSVYLVFTINVENADAPNAEDADGIARTPQIKRCLVGAVGARRDLRRRAWGRAWQDWISRARTWSRTDPAVRVMRALTLSLDPEDTASPGKLVPV